MDQGSDREIEHEMRGIDCCYDKYTAGHIYRTGEGGLEHSYSGRQWCKWMIININQDGGQAKPNIKKPGAVVDSGMGQEE